MKTLFEINECYMCKLNHVEFSNENHCYFYNRIIDITEKELKPDFCKVKNIIVEEE